MDVVARRRSDDVRSVGDPSSASRGRTWRTRCVTTESPRHAHYPRRDGGDRGVGHRGDATRTTSAVPDPSASSTGASANADTQAALNATCVADFAALEGDLQYYVILHGVNPRAGTSWFTTGSSASVIASWPSGPGHFRFTWHGRGLGVTPPHGDSSMGSTGKGSSSGCYAQWS